MKALSRHNHGLEELESQPNCRLDLSFAAPCFFVVLFADWAWRQGNLA